MKTDWKVGDQAYVWYPRKKANARDLKGSIVLVELIEFPARLGGSYYRNRWAAKILLSGFTTVWAKRGRIIYVTPDELYPNIIALTNVLESRYRDYLLSQTAHMADHMGDIYDSSRVG